MGFNTRKGRLGLQVNYSTQISYGAVTWAAHLTNGEIAKLTKLQRVAMVALVQPLRSAPTIGLEAMLGWVPLDLHVKEIGMKTYSRLRSEITNKWDYIGAQNKVCGHIGLWSTELMSALPVGIPVEAQNEEMIWINHNKDDYGPDIVPMNIYTDASKTQDDVGISWVATEGNYIMAEGYDSAKEISIYTAELLAIQEALRWLKDRLPLVKKVVIWSASKGAVSSLNGYKTKNSMAIETMYLLRELTACMSVQIKWVKGHSNCTGNEYADLLARKGAEEARMVSYSSPYVALPPKQVKKAISNAVLRKWQARWDNTQTCKVSHLFKPNVGNEYVITKLSLEEISKLSQIITGHGLFKRHMRHWNEIDDISCALCGEDQEYSWHLWEYCPSLITERKHIRTCMKKGLSKEKAMLKFFYLPEIQELTARNEALLGN